MNIPAQRYFRYFDWISFGIIIALLGLGLLFVFSATTKPDQLYSIYFKKQAFGIISGLLLYALFCITDYRTLCRWGYFLYITVIVLLVFTLIKGSIGMGAQRWIDLLVFRFQPSELAKLFFPAFITYHFYAVNDSLSYSYKDYSIVILSLLVSTLLIIKQPDLGTALLVLFSGFILLWITGLQNKIFIFGAIFFLLSTPILWKFLKPYQKQRIAVFLGEGDSHKERYQLEQSKIAIGSGGLSGKGFLQGTQNKFMFLPESRTDFIFSVICEEFGFQGACLILLLYALLFLRLFYLITTINNVHTQLLALGLIIHTALSTIINIGMVTGLLPIVGIPLPLISYGVTNLWITLASLGWFNGIAIRRFYIGE